MAFRVVDRPTIKPAHCAALVHRGPTAVGERWVDTGAEMPGFDNHVYLSETAVNLAAKALGHPTQAELDEIKLHALMAESERDTAELRIKELEAMVAASDTLTLLIEQLTSSDKKDVK